MRNLFIIQKGCYAMVSISNLNSFIKSQIERQVEAANRPATIAKTTQVGELGDKKPELGSKKPELDLKDMYLKSFDDPEAYAKLNDYITMDDHMKASEMAKAASTDDKIVHPNKYLREIVGVDTMVESITEKMSNKEIAYFLSNVNDRCNNPNGVQHMDYLVHEELTDMVKNKGILMTREKIDLNMYNKYHEAMEGAAHISDSSAKSSYESYLKDKYFGKYEDPESIIKALDSFAEAGGLNSHFVEPDNTITMRFAEGQLIDNPWPSSVGHETRQAAIEHAREITSIESFPYSGMDPAADVSSSGSVAYNGPISDSSSLSEKAKLAESIAAKYLAKTGEDMTVSNNNSPDAELGKS